MWLRLSHHTAIRPPDKTFKARTYNYIMYVVYDFMWPILSRKLTQVQLMMTSSNGNIFRVTGPLCGEFPAPGEFPTQRPVTRSFDVFFDLRLNKRLSKQPWGWWFETPSISLWCHCNVNCHWNSMSVSKITLGWTSLVKQAAGHCDCYFKC